MKQAIIALASVILIVVLAVGGFAATATGPAVAADPVVECQLETSGGATRVVCTAAGVVVLNTVVDLPTIDVPGPTITLPPVTLPPQAQGTPQGPRATLTVNIPGPTVRVPGPTKTVTKSVQVQGPTRTVTTTPAPRPTRTVTTTTTQTVTETATPSVSPSGQSDPDRGTLDEGDGFLSPHVDFGDDRLTIAEAGLGLLSIFALVMVGLLAVYGGYRMGRKSAIHEDTDFIRTLLDNVKINR